MTLPSSGPISFNAINIELGLSGTATKSINDANYRTLAGVASGLIDLQDFYGKSNGPTSTGGTTSVSGSDTRIGAGSKTVTTSTASVGTVSGGTSPYTYLWEYVSGATFTATTSTSPTTTFSRSIFVGVGGYDSASGVYRCKITDNVGGIGYGPNCSVFVELQETS